jgi:hypothetical protein
MTKATSWRVSYMSMRFLFSDMVESHSLFAGSPILHWKSVPQHILGGWLVTGLWLHSRRVGWGVSHWAVLLTPTLLWSPFVTVGLAVMIAVDVLAEPGFWRQLVGQWHRSDGWTLGAVSVPMGLLISYIAAHQPVGYVGFLPAHWQQPNDAGLFLLYIGVLLVLPLWLLTRATRHQPALVTWLTLPRLSVWAITGLMLVHVGYFNDFQMRATIPAQFVCSLTIANGLILTVTNQTWRNPAPHRSQWARVALWSWAVLSMLPAIRLVSLTLWTWHRNPQWVHIADSRTDISRLVYDNEDGLPPIDFAGQYLGQQDSWYWTWVSPATAQRNGEKSVGVK